MVENVYDLFCHMDTLDHDRVLQKCASIAAQYLEDDCTVQQSDGHQLFDIVCEMAAMANRLRYELCQHFYRMPKQELKKIFVRRRNLDPDNIFNSVCEKQAGRILLEWSAKNRAKSA